MPEHFVPAKETTIHPKIPTEMLEQALKDQVKGLFSNLKNISLVTD